MPERVLFRQVPPAPLPETVIHVAGHGRGWAWAVVEGSPAGAGRGCCDVNGEASACMAALRDVCRWLCEHVFEWRERQVVICCENRSALEWAMQWDDPIAIPAQTANCLRWFDALIIGRPARYDVQALARAEDAIPPDTVMEGLFAP